MKKTVLSILLILCVALGVFCLSACNDSNDDFLLPEFSVANQGYTVEHITNKDSDFDFPIGGLKLDHSKFVNEGMLQFGWVIYNNDHELVGWIETDGGYTSSKKGEYKYGFSASTANGVYGYGNPTVCIVLKSTSVSLFNGVTVTCDNADITKSELGANNASNRYCEYDSEHGTMIVAPNASEYVYCNYNVQLEGIKPSEISSLKITLDLGEVGSILLGQPTLGGDDFYLE